MSHHHHHHESAGGKGLFLSILFNSVIVVGEFIGAFLSGSLALFSDAIHNLSDVIALILSYFGEKIAAKKGDKRYTFDYKRAEVIIAFVNSGTLILIGGYIIYEAIVRYFSPHIAVNSSLMFWIGLLGLFGNLASLFFLHQEKDDNLNKRSAYLHLLYDAISSVLVVVGGGIIYFTKYYEIDLIASIIISFFVIRSGLEVFLASLRILMQAVPEGMDVEKVFQEIKSISGVMDIHYLRIWSIDSHEKFLSVHIVVASDKNQEEMIQSVNKMLHDHYEIHHTSLQIVKINCCKNV